MIRLTVVLVGFFLAMSVNAKDGSKSPSIQAVNYADGIEFQVSDTSVDIQLTVAGPENSRFSQRYTGETPVFLDVSGSLGADMPDGLYKYEAWPVPAVTISREESSRMPDRNSLKHLGDQPVSPVSGTFRIVNGAMVDFGLPEYNLAVEGGDDK